MTERMTPERLVKLERKAYGKGGERIHDSDLMEASQEIRRAWAENEQLLEDIEDLKDLHETAIKYATSGVSDLHTYPPPRLKR